MTNEITNSNNVLGEGGMGIVTESGLRQREPMENPYNHLYPLSSAQSEETIAVATKFEKTPQDNSLSISDIEELFGIEVTMDNVTEIESLDLISYLHASQLLNKDLYVLPTDPEEYIGVINTAFHKLLTSDNLSESITNNPVIREGLISNLAMEITRLLGNGLARGATQIRFKKVRNEEQINPENVKFEPYLVFDLYSKYNYSLDILYDDYYQADIGNSAKARLYASAFLKLFYKYASDLKLLHDFNIVVKDIKPGNIIFDNNSFLITDFGIGTTGILQNQEARPLQGTLEFMSLEQLCCKTLDGKADTFALGMSIIGILANTYPLKRDKTKSSLAPHPDSRYRFVDGSYLGTHLNNPSGCELHDDIATLIAKHLGLNIGAATKIKNLLEPLVLNSNDERQDNVNERIQEVLGIINNN